MLNVTVLLGSHVCATWFKVHIVSICWKLSHTCLVHVVLLHCILNYMFSLLMFIIANVMFYLFYLQVEPVFYRRTNKAIRNPLLCHQ